MNKRGDDGGSSDKVCDVMDMVEVMNFVKSEIWDGGDGKREGRVKDEAKIFSWVGRIRLSSGQRKNRVNYFRCLLRETNKKKFSFWRIKS